MSVVDYQKPRLTEEEELKELQRKKVKVLEDAYEWLAKWKNDSVASNELGNEPHRFANQLEYDLRCISLSFLEREHQENGDSNRAAGTTISSSTKRTMQHDLDHQYDKLRYVIETVNLLRNNMLNRYNQEKRRQRPNNGVDGLSIRHGTTTTGSGNRLKYSSLLSSLDSTTMVARYSCKSSESSTDPQRDIEQQHISSPITQDFVVPRENDLDDHSLLRRRSSTTLMGTSSDDINHCASALPPSKSATDDENAAGLLPYQKTNHIDERSMFTQSNHHNSNTTTGSTAPTELLTFTGTSSKITRNNTNSKKRTIMPQVDPVTVQERQHNLWVEACAQERVNKLRKLLPLSSESETPKMTDHDDQQDADDDSKGVL